MPLFTDESDSDDLDTDTPSPSPARPVQFNIISSSDDEDTNSSKKKKKPIKKKPIMMPSKSSIAKIHSYMLPSTKKRILLPLSLVVQLLPLLFLTLSLVVQEALPLLLLSLPMLLPLLSLSLIIHLSLRALRAQMLHPHHWRTKQSNWRRSRVGIFTKSLKKKSPREWLLMFIV